MKAQSQRLANMQKEPIAELLVAYLGCLESPYSQRPDPFTALKHLKRIKRAARIIRQARNAEEGLWDRRGLPQAEHDAVDRMKRRGNRAIDRLMESVRVLKCGADVNLHTTGDKPRVCVTYPAAPDTCCAIHHHPNLQFYL